MPRYFIDLHDGANFVRDTDGFDLADDETARLKLVRILGRIAQEFAAEPERQDVLAIVRDEGGTTLLRARLSLDIERIEAA